MTGFLNGKSWTHYAETELKKNVYHEPLQRPGHRSSLGLRPDVCLVINNCGPWTLKNPGNCTQKLCH